MRDWWAPLAVALLVPVGLVYLVVRVSRWHAGLRDPIDALIAKNIATPRKDMEEVDWSKTDRAGKMRWQQTLRAQRKARTKPRQKKDVVQFDARRKA